MNRQSFLAAPECSAHRYPVEQAKGALAERTGVSVIEAFSGCGATPAGTTSASTAVATSVLEGTIPEEILTPA